MTFNISPADIAVFINLALFVGQVTAIFLYRTRERKMALAVIQTNSSLISSVTDLVNTLEKVLEQNKIKQAVDKAMHEEEEFIIE